MPMVTGTHWSLCQSRCDFTFLTLTQIIRINSIHRRPSKSLTKETMGLAKLFGIKRECADKKKNRFESQGTVSTSGCTTSSHSTGATIDETRKNSRSEAKTASTTTEIINTKSPNVKQVEAFLEFACNYTNMDDLLSFYTPNGALFIPEDVPPLPMENFARLMHHLNESFPDFKLVWESVKEEGNNLVVVEKAWGSGTHTGTAYCPMPGKLSPIPTSGLHVSVDEERFFFELEDGKIKSFSVVALGMVTGPIGMYERLQDALSH